MSPRLLWLGALVSFLAWSYACSAALMHGSFSVATGGAERHLRAGTVWAYASWALFAITVLLTCGALWLGARSRRSASRLPD